MTIQNTNFTFLPNGKPVSSIKNEARKLHKSGEVKGLANAQNKISKALFNKSFNKLVKDVEEVSPVLTSDYSFLYQDKLNDAILRLPVRITKEDVNNAVDEDFTYYVAMNEMFVAGSIDNRIDISEYVNLDFFKNLKLENFERLNFHTEKNISNNLRGWNIFIDENHFIQINKSDECLFIELIYFENGSVDTIVSTYVEYDEMVQTYSDYNIIKDEIVSDHQMAFKVGHDTIDQTTALYNIGGIYAYIYGTTTFETEDGVKGMYEMTSDMTVEERSKELELFLEGHYIESLENTVNVTSNPFYGYELENGDVLDCEAYSELPKTLSEKAFDVAEYFLKEVQ